MAPWQCPRANGRAEIRNISNLVPSLPSSGPVPVRSNSLLEEELATMANTRSDPLPTTSEHNHSASTIAIFRSLRDGALLDLVSGGGLDVEESELRRFLPVLMLTAFSTAGTSVGDSPEMVGCGVDSIEQIVKSSSSGRTTLQANHHSGREPTPPADETRLRLHRGQVPGHVRVGGGAATCPHLPVHNPIHTAE
jgi:hypothetical protein